MVASCCRYETTHIVSSPLGFSQEQGFAYLLLLSQMCHAVSHLPPSTVILHQWLNQSPMMCVPLL